MKPLKRGNSVIKDPINWFSYNPIVLACISVVEPSRRGQPALLND